VCGVTVTGQLLVAALATLCVVFGVSAASKAGSTRQRAFAKSLRALRLLPASLVLTVAVAVSCVELMIAVGLAAALVGVVIGAWWALSAAVLSMLLAVALLSVLTAGIVLALSRRSTATCACFGASVRPLSWRHVLRNGLMLLVGVIGTVITVAFSPAVVVDPVGAGLTGVAGVVIAVVLIRLDEIVELFTPTGLAGRSQVRS
jgi:hypothetical protein